MKYLIIVPGFNIGGSERIQYLVSKYLIKKNVDLTIFFLTTKNINGDNFWSNIPKKNIITSCKIKEFSGLISLFKLFAMNKYDVIFTSNSHLNGFVCLLRLMFFRFTSRIIIRQSTDIYKRFFGFKYFYFYIIHSLYLFSSKIIFQHEEMKISFLKKHKYLFKKSEVLLNPVELSEIISKKTISSRYKIVMIGRLDENKNHLLAIRAIKELNDKTISIDIYGNGPLYSKLNDFISKNKLIENVKIIEKYTPINEILSSNYDLLLHTSHVEGFPNVIIESMAQKIPNIITTKSCSQFNNMPNLTIIENYTDASLKILEAKKNKPDNSESYFSYIKKNHNLEIFLNKIFKF